MKLKSIANAGIHRMNRFLMRCRLGLQTRFGLVNPYQPDPFAPNGSVASRQCADRFAAFSPLLPEAPLSFMDIGCNRGYFVFRLAERGGFGLGLDTGRNEIMVARALAELHEVRNVAFAEYKLSPDNIVTLPGVDLVVFLSLFHHFVRHFGEAAALDMLAAIAGRAKRFLVFETGQPDEDSDWARELAFMGKDVKAWAEETLGGFGFDRVHHLGRFPTSVSAVERHLLLAERVP